MRNSSWNKPSVMANCSTGYTHTVYVVLETLDVLEHAILTVLGAGGRVELGTNVSMISTGHSMMS